jgi:hypothetical protein
MTDDINEPEPTPEEQEPIEAEVVPNEPKEQPEKVSTRQPSILSTLPPELLEEVDTRLKSGEKVKVVREDMIKKYPAVEQLKVGYLTWLNRFKKLNGGAPKEVESGVAAKKEMVSALPTANDLQNVVSKVIDPEISIENKKEALAALFNKATERLKILENRQRNYIDPDIESLIGSYMREQRALLETVTKLQEVLQRDVLAQMRGELDEYTRVILTTVYAAYKLSHSDTDPSSKFDFFRITLEVHLAQTLKAYKTNSSKSA